jgi:hypothetical protein
MPERPNVMAPMMGVGVGMEEGGRRITLLNLENPGFLPRDSSLQQGQTQCFELQLVPQCDLMCGQWPMIPS